MIPLFVYLTFLIVAFVLNGTIYLLYISAHCHLAQTILHLTRINF